MIFTACVNLIQTEISFLRNKTGSYLRISGYNHQKNKWKINWRMGPRLKTEMLGQRFNLIR